MLDDPRPPRERDGCPRAALGAVEMDHVGTDPVERLEKHRRVRRCADHAVSGLPCREASRIQQAPEGGVATAHERDVVRRQRGHDFFPRRVGTRLVHGRDSHEHGSTPIGAVTSDESACPLQPVPVTSENPRPARGGQRRGAKGSRGRAATPPATPSTQSGERLRERPVRPAHILGRQARDSQRDLADREPEPPQSLDGVRDGHGPGDRPGGLRHRKRPGAGNIEDLGRMPSTMATSSRACRARSSVERSTSAGSSRAAGRTTVISARRGSASARSRFASVKNGPDTTSTSSTDSDVLDSIPSVPEHTGSPARAVAASRLCTGEDACECLRVCRVRSGVAVTVGGIEKQDDATLAGLSRWLTAVCDV